jgi:hypothetical protein
MVSNRVCKFRVNEHVITSYGKEGVSDVLEEATCKRY